MRGSVREWDARHARTLARHPMLPCGLPALENGLRKNETALAESMPTATRRKRDRRGRGWRRSLAHMERRDVVVARSSGIVRCNAAHIAQMLTIRLRLSQTMAIHPKRAICGYRLLARAAMRLARKANP